MRERLHKVLARAGIASRRQCEKLIVEKRVAVDGRVVTELGTEVDPRTQTIKVDGVRVKMPRAAYYLLNKPRGVVCSAAEDERRPRAIDFAPRGAGRLFTIGRLDRDSEGLVILTNDGELTERLTHPRHDIPKTYRVVVRGLAGAETLAKLRKGVWLAEGKATVSAIKVLGTARSSGTRKPRSAGGRTSRPGRERPPLPATAPATILEVELREGKNREIRRIMARVGHPVRELRRTAIGPIRMAGLGPGKVRPLDRDEIEVLREAAGRGARPPAEAIGAARAGRPPGRTAAGSPKIAPEGPPGPNRRAARARARAPGPAPVGPATGEAPPARTVPDEDGVIVIRRPHARFSEEE